MRGAGVRRDRNGRAGVLGIVGKLLARRRGRPIVGVAVEDPQRYGDGFCIASAAGGIVRHRGDEARRAPSGWPWNPSHRALRSRPSNSRRSRDAPGRYRAATRIHASAARASAACVRDWDASAAGILDALRRERIDGDGNVALCSRASRRSRRSAWCNPRSRAARGRPALAAFPPAARRMPAPRAWSPSRGCSCSDRPRHGRRATRRRTM